MCECAKDKNETFSIQSIQMNATNNREQAALQMCVRVCALSSYFRLCLVVISFLSKNNENNNY